jgi:hypothetical protein
LLVLFANFEISQNHNASSSIIEKPSIKNGVHQGDFVMFQLTMHDLLNIEIIKKIKITEIKTKNI